MNDAIDLDSQIQSNSRGDQAETNSPLVLEYELLKVGIEDHYDSWWT